jgi:hypothetical protein
MLKPFFLFLLFSNLLQAQNSVLILAKDSDLVLLNHSRIAEFKISNISFIENLDSLQFLNYPMPAKNIKYLKHYNEYNTEGFSKSYEWSFSNSIELKETNQSTGSFFIANEYKYEYNNSKIKNILISDASPISKISYDYIADSIFQEITIFSTSLSSQVVKKSFNKDYNKIIFRNTGNKQQFFPTTQIICLGKISSNNIYISSLPFLSFFDKKFDNNRFLVEIRPGMWILFEIIS